MKQSIVLIVSGLMVSVASPALAQSTRTSVDVSVGGSAATNPFLVADAEAAASVTISVDPSIFIEDERGQTAIQGNLRYSQYTNRYGGDEAGRLTVSTDYAIDERTNTSAGAFVSTSRTPLRDNLAFGLGGLLEPDGIDDFEVPFLDPSVVGGRTRVTRYGLNSGISYALDTTSSISGSLEASATEFDGPGIEYRDLGGSVAYSRRVSERATVSAVGQLNYVDYRQGFGSSFVASPSINANLQLSQTVTISGGLGVSYVWSDRESMSESSFVFAGNARLCNRGQASALCFGASHSARPTAFGAISRVTSLAANYDRRLSETQNLSFGARYSHTGSILSEGVPGELEQVDVPLLFNDARDLFGLDARYSQELTDRLSFFVSPSFIFISDGEDDDDDLDGDTLDLGDRDPNYEVNFGLTMTFGAR